MSGPIALHGGGEFLPGDEPFLLALLEAARAEQARRMAAPADRTHRSGPLVVAVVPTAAARGQPDLAARHGRTALERVAAGAGFDVAVATVPVVDAASANDPALAARLADADVVHFPGGDPDLIPQMLAGSRAWAAIADAHARGASVAGASAGAMALADRTWTPRGWIDGLGLVHGFIVVPHFGQFEPRGREGDIAMLDAAGLARLGLDERTGVIREPDGRWRVAGEGRAHWIAVGGATVSAAHGELLPIGA